MARFAIDTLKIHSESMSAVTLRGIGSAAHALSRSTTGPNSGNTYDEARFITEVDDEFSFSNVIALASLLANVSPLVGKCISDDGSHPGMVLYGQLLSRCGTDGRGSAGTAASITAKHGHLIVSSFGGSKNQLATASVRGINLLDSGETRPTVTVYNATLPSTFVGDEAFVIGPVEVAGVTLSEDEIVSVQVETNISVQVVKNLEGYGTTVLILKSQPIIRIGVEDSSILADDKIDYEGVACAHADTSISFMALDPEANVKARAETEHIIVTANGKAYLEDHLSGGGPAVAGSTIVIETTQTSGGTAPLVVTTGVALS